MKIGIFGADGRKWNSMQEQQAKDKIRGILSGCTSCGGLRGDHPHYLCETYDEPIVVSGHCPVGKEKLWCHECHKFYDQHDGAKTTLVYDEGGVDSWAEIIADSLGIKKEIHPAPAMQWEDKLYPRNMLPNPDFYQTVTVKGFKTRNIEIAESIDVGYCFSPKCNCDQYYECPICFPQIHRSTGATHGHVWNGGLWTAWKAEKLGKKVVRIAI